MEKNIKKMLVLLGAMLLIALCLPVTAATQEEAFTLRVGYQPGYGVTKDVYGNLSGYFYDYMYEIARINHWELEWSPYDWAQGLEQLKSGEIDTFGPMQKTPEREKLFDYPKIPIGYESGTLYVRNDNPDIFYGDLGSMHGKTLGSLRDTDDAEYFLNACAAQGITIKSKTMDSTEALNQALADGSIDIGISGNLLIPSNTKVVLQLDVHDFFFPTTKGNQTVLMGFEYALAQIKRENPYYDRELYNQHSILAGAQKKAFTAEEQAWIDQASVLRVGYEATNKPTEYYDEESHSGKGVMIDLLQEIAAYSGLHFDYVKTDSLEQALNMIEDGEIHLVSGLIRDKDFTATYRLNPSNTIMTTTLVFIAKQGATMDKNETLLALPEKWVGIRHQMKQNYPNFVIQTFPDVKSCLDAVLNGHADMSVLNVLSAGEFLKQQQYRELIANSMEHDGLPICLGIAMDTDPILYAILNKSTAAIDSHTRSQIMYRHTISIPYEAPLSEVLQYNLLTICSSLTVLMLILYLSALHSRRRLNRMAYRDPLTNEMNLVKFKLETQKLMNGSKKTCSVMVLDIDKFKSINDIYGYDFGDEIIVLMAKAIRASIQHGTIICHGAADTFYLFFDFLDKDWIKELFDRIVKNINAEIHQSRLDCHLILSGGVCVIQLDDNNIVSIIDRANIASKQIKGHHESCFAFYDPSMYARLNHIHTLENDMCAALENNEFLVYLQPKIDISNYQIAGAEALVRWKHPEKGLVLPSDFIPLFEENGFIINLDFYVLDYVCTLLEEWKAAGRQLFPISVNLSRRHLFYSDTVDQIANIVSRYDVEPSLIEVELTESAFDNFNVNTMNKLLDELHDAGFTVSVDDFGAGYSSLSLLKDLSIDVLKIDKSFFDTYQNCKPEKMAILLESIISLSRKLGIKTVSEGVETQQQVNLLLQLGCDLVQGFYFARPMLPKQLEQLLEVGNTFGERGENKNQHQLS